MDHASAHHIATLVGHRIAIDTLLGTVITDLYSRIDNGGDAFERVAQEAITALHGIGAFAVGSADAEFVKQHALHALESLTSHVPNLIRQQQGLPPKQPS